MAHEQDPTSSEAFPPPLAFRIYNRRSGADADKCMADYADMKGPLKELIGASLSEGAPEPEPGELLRDIGRRLRPECVVPIYDEWAHDASFDPDRVGFEEAAWIAEDGKGKQVALRTHLAEDEDSPCGFGWYTEAYSWDDGLRCWKEEEGYNGVWWGYRDAADLVAEFSEVDLIDWNDRDLTVARVECEYLADLGVDGDVEHPRRASRQELASASEERWPAGRILYPSLANLKQGDSGMRAGAFRTSTKTVSVVLKENDGVWSCAASARTMGQAFLANAVAPTPVEAYSAAFDALAASCALRDVEMLVANPACPARPYKSIGEQREHEGIDASWTPSRRQAANEPARGAAVPVPPRAERRGRAAGR